MAICVNIPLVERYITLEEDKNSDNRSISLTIGVITNSPIGKIKASGKTKSPR